jgi:hypothetical protein
VHAVHRPYAVWQQDVVVRHEDHGRVAALGGKVVPQPVRVDPASVDRVSNGTQSYDFRIYNNNASVVCSRKSVLECKMKYIYVQNILHRLLVD